MYLSLFLSSTLYFTHICSYFFVIFVVSFPYAKNHKNFVDHKNVVLPTYFLHVQDRSNPCGSKAQAVWYHKPT